jgi:hypothetical protein
MMDTEKKDVCSRSRRLARDGTMVVPSEYLQIVIEKH